MVNALAGLMDGANIAQQFQDTYDRSRLNMLAGKAYSTPQAERQSLLGNMASIDPRAAQGQQQQWQADEDRQTKMLVNTARYMKGALDSKNPNAVAGAWNSVRPALIRAGLATEQELSPTWDPSYEQTVHQVLAMGGPDVNGATPTDVRSFQMMTAGLSLEDQMKARRINLGLDGRQSSAAIGYQKVKGADGIERLVAVDPRQIGAQVVGDGIGYGSFASPVENGPPVDGGGLDFANDAQQFAALGIPVSSTVRSERKNAQVGGVANSYHLTGEAMDVAPQNAQQKQQAQQYWRSRGYQVIDEGDHLHIEPPRRGMTTSRLQGGVNPFAGRRPEDEAGAVEAAKQQAQLAYLPQELGLRTQADIAKARGVEGAKAEVDRASKRQGLQDENNRSFSLYEAAMQGIIEGLGGTTTGPLMGRLPAVTADQQKAEGSIAAIAPVLKQLFRSAGEGTFTDKDQELLLAMIPTRTDHAESRNWKIANIDRIVREKLGQQPNGGGQPAAGRPQQRMAPRIGTVEGGYRYKGGNPADPNSWERM